MSDDDRVVAALFVERGGPYFDMPGVDPWDVARDARTYMGPHPIVAHPPCGAWSDLSHLAAQSDADCATIALRLVRRWGGVLEHPHRSKLWRTLPALGESDAHGFTVQVDQCAWGHVARKRTRLYLVGIERALVERTMRTGGTPTHWVCGSRNPRDRRRGGVCPPGIKFCSAAQRRRTPPFFASWLVALARSTRGAP